MEDRERTTTKSRSLRGKPGRPAAGESLTPGEITEEALRLIAAEGEQALTMRALGERLGVKAMALYNHFPDKEAILEAVANLALSRLPAPASKGPWKTRVKVFCRSVRSMALQSPELFRVAMSRPIPPSGSLQQIELLLAAFKAAGLAHAEQASAYHALRIYVRSYCLWEIEELRRHPVDPVEVARLAAPFPHVSRVAHDVFGPDSERPFEAGLEIVLRGVLRGAAE